MRWLSEIRCGSTTPPTTPGTAGRGPNEAIRQRVDPEYRQRHLASAAIAGVRLFGVEGSRAESHPQHRPGTGFCRQAK